MTPELLAPGGSFDAGIAAIRCGADAVYAGLDRFSARAAAKNLTITEFRRLIAFAKKLGRKVYLTVNTILTDKETDEALDQIFILQASGLDAVIVQDTGLAFALKQAFPNLRLHASTQLAAHNADGLAVLAAAGFSRAVLAREMTFEEIRIAMQSSPAIETEIFIHGALCYSVSGLCLASGMMLSRSANRGECAQLCRSWWDHPGGPRWLFSMSDLNLSGRLSLIQDAGITAVKIEGRMKSHVYVSAAVCFYRKLLDEGISDAALQRELDTAFSRRYTTGFFDTRKPDDLLRNEYPEHRGVRAGIVKHTGQSKIYFTTEINIERYDGLLFFAPAPGKPGGIDTVGFSVQDISLADGRSVYQAAAGSHISIACPKSVPAAGTELRLVSRTRHDMKLPAEDWLPDNKQTIPIEIIISDLTFICRTAAPEWSFCKEWEISLAEARSPADITLIIKQEFEKSGESILCCTVNAVHINSSFKKIFLNKTILKNIRREWYTMLEKYLRDTLIGSLFTPITACNSAHPDTQPQLSQKLHDFIACRKNLSPAAGTGIPAHPFAFTRALQNPETLARCEDVVFIPLPPAFVPREYEETLKNCLSGIKNFRVAIGVNNIGHWQLLHRLTAPDVYPFLDFFSYCANRFMPKWHTQFSNRILFGYQWLERGTDEIQAPFPIIPVGKKFSPPLFYSRACVRGAAGKGGCSSCPGYFSEQISMHGKMYNIITVDCISMLFV